MSKPLILSLWLVVTVADCIGQTRLIFLKNKNKFVYYEAGDVLSFTINGGHGKITDQIKGFAGDSLIIFDEHEASVLEITGIYLDKKNKDWYFLKYKYATLFLMMGTGYFLLDVLNTGELDKGTLMISSSLIAAGILAKVMISERIKVGGKKKLKILNL